MKTCAATTSNGTRCSRKAHGRSKYCKQHKTRRRKRKTKKVCPPHKENSVGQCEVCGIVLNPAQFESSYEELDPHHRRNPSGGVNELLIINPHRRRYPPLRRYRRWY